MRVGIKDEAFYQFNKHTDRDNISESDLDLVMAGDGELVTNIDSNANELVEDRYIEAMEFGLQSMIPWLEAQKNFVGMVDGIEKPEYESFALPEDLVSEVESKYGDEIGGNLLLPSHRDAKTATLEKMNEDFTGQYSKKQLDDVYEKLAKKELLACVQWK